jgi:hypothetical protein
MGILLNVVVSVAAWGDREMVKRDLQPANYLTLAPRLPHFLSFTFSGSAATSRPIFVESSADVPIHPLGFFSLSGLELFCILPRSSFDSFCPSYIKSAS